MNTLVNSPERVITEVGVIMSGAASVNGQRLMADGSDLLRTLRQSRASAILLDPDVIESPWNVVKQYITINQSGTIMQSSKLPDLRKIYFVHRDKKENSSSDFLGFLKLFKSFYQCPDLSEDNLVTVYTTSGSTGYSKLVPAPHKFLIDLILASGNIETVSTTVSLNVGPLGWLGASVFLNIAEGRTKVLCDVRAEGQPEDIVAFLMAMIDKENVSQAIIGPQHIPDLAEKFKSEAFSKKLKLLILGGLPISKVIVKAG